MLDTLLGAAIAAIVALTVMGKQNRHQRRMAEEARRHADDKERTLRLRRLSNFLKRVADDCAAVVGTLGQPTASETAADASIAVLSAHIELWERWPEIDPFVLEDPKAADMAAKVMFRLKAAHKIGKPASGEKAERSAIRMYADNIQTDARTAILLIERMERERSP